MWMMVAYGVNMVFGENVLFIADNKNKYYSKSFNLIKITYIHRSSQYKMFNINNKNVHCIPFYVLEYCNLISFK